MATKILSRILRNLAYIYRFPSEQKGAPGELELDLPIQTVQDLSELSAVGAARGFSDGWFVGKTQHGHVATGTIESTFFPRWATVRFGIYGSGSPVFSADEYNMWLYDWWLDHDDATDFNNATMALRHAALAVGPAEPLGQTSTVYDRVIGRYQQTTAVGQVVNAGLEDADTFVQVIRPLPMPTQQGHAASLDPLLYNRSVADTTGTITFFFFYLFSIVPKGIRPLY